jgi:ribonuclease HI
VALEKRRIRLYTDGSSIGNPGAAGIAYLLKDELGNTLAEGREPLGTATNNQAEYRAFLRGLELARRLDACEVEWFSDSELLVKQWQGVYRIKDAGLRQLMQEARRLAQGMLIRPYAVPRNSSPEMAQVDRWARGVALGELEPIAPSRPPAATDRHPTRTPSRSKKCGGKPQEQASSQMGLFSPEEEACTNRVGKVSENKRD